MKFVKRRSMLLLMLVRSVVLALLIYGALMFVLQRRVAFPGTARESSRPRADAPAGVTQAWLAASFGQVEAWLVAAPDRATAPTLVFAHGNGEIMEDWRNAMEQVARAGANVLMVEFPGYGHSEGSPSRPAIRETFGHAYDWLVEEAGVDPEGIVAWGRSIGGGAAGDLARDRPVRALVLQSTFSSAMRVAREMFLPGFLVRDRWDNVSAVAEFPGPVLVMHGPADEVIGYRHAEALAAARPGLSVTPIPCGHNDCLEAWPDIVAPLTSFLRANGLLDSPPTSGAGN